MTPVRKAGYEEAIYRGSDIWVPREVQAFRLAGISVLRCLRQKGREITSKRVSRAYREEGLGRPFLGAAHSPSIPEMNTLRLQKYVESFPPPLTTDPTLLETASRHGP